MPDRSDITSVRITSSARWAGRLADAIAGMDGYTVIKRQETPLSNRAAPGLRVHLTVLHGYPPAARLAAWLAANGWCEQSRLADWALWSKRDARVGVPLDDSDEAYTKGALDRIAAAEGTTVGALVAAIHVQEPGKDGQ